MAKDQAGGRSESGKNRGAAKAPHGAEINRRLVRRLAKRIRTAGESGSPCVPVTDEIAETDIRAAYAIQKTNTTHWVDRGRRIIGRKIGLARPSDQQRFGLDAPIHGVLYADMLIASGAHIASSRLIQPKVEPEIAVVLERDLVKPQLTILDLMYASAFVIPALEITDTRYPAGEATVADDIADNCSSGLFVIGIRPVALSDAMFGRTILRIDRGRGGTIANEAEASLNEALAVAAWLADRMVAENTPLRAGDVILTGAILDEVPLSSGDHIELAIDGFESVSATLR